MNYIINGDEVKAERYETDRNDNFNVGIAFVEDYDAYTDTVTMTYGEGA